MRFGRMWMERILLVLLGILEEVTQEFHTVHSVVGSNDEEVVGAVIDSIGSDRALWVLDSDRLVILMRV